MDDPVDHDGVFIPRDTEAYYGRMQNTLEIST